MKIGVAGNGKIVETFMEAVREVSGVKVEAICCREKSVDKGREFAKDYGFEKVYTNYRDMINDEEIDFVYIGLPNSLHYEYAKEALLSGNNVICEKPFTSTIEETEDLCTIARNNKLFLFEAITTIHTPNFRFIKESLSAIGDIKLVTCNFSQYSSRYDSFLEGNVPLVFDPKFSGGALADINIYNIHFVQGLFGKPDKVTYCANKGSNGIDTSGIVTMSYKDFYAVCIGAKDCNGDNSICIQGTKGYIKLNGSANECNSVSIYLNTEVNEEMNKQFSKNRMVYELKEFRDIFSNKDYEKCYELLKHTEEVMDTAVKARKDAGIIFEADKCE